MLTTTLLTDNVPMWTPFTSMPKTSVSIPPRRTTLPNWITHDVSRRQSRGVFSIPEVTQTPSSDTVNVPVATDAISNMDAERIAENILVSS